MLTVNHELKAFTLQDIYSCNFGDCRPILSSLEKELKTNLLGYSELVGVTHSTEVAMLGSITQADVSVQNVEYPQQTLKKSNESKKLLAFSYEELKQKSNLSRGKYRGKLYATIEDHICNTLMNCPECNGTGVCSNCSGTKQVTCPVCDGCTECPKCEGSGRYTCPKCDGSGWIECDNCEDGIYYEDCRDCNGTGWYRDGILCRTCDGTGQFGKTCRTCGGEGGWDCDYCDDDCCVECKACDGSGICGKCHGNGNVWCPSCHGKGICFDCKGDKMVKCTRCEGSGVYQSVDEYTFEEKKKKYQYCSIDNLNDIDTISSIIKFDDTLYDIFANKVNIDNVSIVLENVPIECQSFVNDWISLEKYVPDISKGLSNKYFHMHAKVTIFPATKFILSCRNKEFNIWIVGNNNLIIFDNLPNWKDKSLGSIRIFLKGWYQKK